MNTDTVFCLLDFLLLLFLNQKQNIIKSHCFQRDTSKNDRQKLILSNGTVHNQDVRISASNNLQKTNNSFIVLKIPEFHNSYRNKCIQIQRNSEKSFCVQCHDSGAGHMNK